MSPVCKICHQLGPLGLLVIKSSCQIYSLLLVKFWLSTRLKELTKNFLHKKTYFTKKNFLHKKNFLTKILSNQKKWSLKESFPRLFFTNVLYIYLPLTTTTTTHLTKKSHKKCHSTFLKNFLSKQLHFKKKYLK